MRNKKIDIPNTLKYKQIVTIELIDGDKKTLYDCAYGSFKNDTDIRSEEDALNVIQISCKGVYIKSDYEKFKISEDNWSPIYHYIDFIPLSQIKSINFELVDSKTCDKITDKKIPHLRGQG